MCHNPDPLAAPFHESQAVHCLLPCTSTLGVRYTRVPLLPKQLCHEEQYYATNKRRSSRKNL
jgi:hypothetical protein